MVMKMLNRKRIIREAIIILLCITFVMAFPITVNAASKKTVYVKTSLSMIDYSSNEDGVKYKYSLSYDKYGLLKSCKYVCDDEYVECKSTFKYGKNNKITQRIDKYYYLDELNAKQTCKITMNKDGYLTGYKYYAKDGSLIRAKKFTYNKKNLCTKVRDYDSNEDLTAYRKITYNKDKSRKARKYYNADSELTFREKYTYNGNKCKVYFYDANGDLIETCVKKYSKDGRLLSETYYDETLDNKCIQKNTYKYKKVKTTKSGKVEAQQMLLADLSF